MQTPTNSPSPLAPYKRHRRRIVVTAIVAAALGAWWYLLDSGFCVSRMRYVSDRELIESALRYEASATIREPGSSVSIRQMLIDGSEESIQDFLQKHPRCCSADRHPWRRNILDVLTGFNITEVELNYERNGSPEQLARWGRYHKSFISVDACGPVLKGAGGTSTDTLENAF